MYKNKNVHKPPFYLLLTTATIYNPKVKFSFYNLDGLIFFTRRI